MKHQPIDWASKSDEDFVKTAEMQIWLSAFANNNPRAPAHAEADAAYDEATARNKKWLYQKAYNDAVASCGYPISDRDREAATEAGWLRQEAERKAHFDALQA
jgi:hypothetical protein